MKSKKSALLLSFTSLLICFAMLVGYLRLVHRYGDYGGE